MYKDNESIRGYRPGDEHAIVDLHKQVFGSDIDLEKWRWQFLEHNQGAAWITLAEVNSDIVAQYCMMRNHLNFNGTERIAGQSCDTMVRSNQRGKRWFTRLANRNYADASNSGLEAVFGFPNRASYPAFMKYLEWTKICNCKYYRYRIGLRPLLGSTLDTVFKLFLRLRLLLRHKILYLRSPEVNITISETLPTDFASALKDIRNHEVLSLWKDIDYLKWRYEHHPKTKYFFHLLSVDQALEGLIVTRRRRDNIAICEILNRTKSISQTAIHLNHILIHYVGSSAQKIEFHGFDSAFFDSVFARVNFCTEISPFVLGGRVFHDAALRAKFALPHNWSVSYGDTDVV